ncbi:hypothetical protein PAXINDRAFT_170044, partial [Paxillus involutus ATCC 200175]
MAGALFFVPDDVVFARAPPSKSAANTLLSRRSHSFSGACLCFHQTTNHQDQEIR